MAYGYVVDFLQFHWDWLKPVFSGGYFPAFNIANSAISIGAVCLILDEILRVGRAKERAAFGRIPALFQRH